MHTQLRELDMTGIGNTGSAAHAGLKRIPRDLMSKTCMRIIDCSTQILSSGLPLAGEVGAKEKMRRKWLAVLATYPYGTLPQVRFALSTLCISIKLNVLFRKGNEHNLEKYDIKYFRGGSVSKTSPAVRPTVSFITPHKAYIGLGGTTKKRAPPPEARTSL